MPWTILVSKPNQSQLGEVANVEVAIKAALPEARFFREATGAEKLEAVPPEAREFFAKTFGHLPATRQGVFEAEDFSLEFFLGSETSIDRITIDVRGTGNPIGALRRLCKQNGWVAEEPGRRALDLDAESLPGWEEFTEYRDRVVDELKSERQA
jgi:hypothetical protein